MSLFKTGEFQDHDSIPIGSMYGIYANIGGILMVNVTIYSIHGSYGIWIHGLSGDDSDFQWPWAAFDLFQQTQLITPFCLCNPHCLVVKLSCSLFNHSYWISSVSGQIRILAGPTKPFLEIQWPFRIHSPQKDRTDRTMNQKAISLAHINHHEPGTLVDINHH